MKKLIASTIIILPLLLLAILLVSGAFLSLITHIYVESVSFASNDTIVLVMEDEENPPSYNLAEDITILPLKASNRDLVYVSEDEDVLTINQAGVITPVFYGQTYISVQSKENKVATAKRKVIVTDKSVHRFVMSDFPTDMFEGETFKLSVQIYPEQAENKAIEWKSSNEDILQVSADGTVTAMAKSGKATITATSLDNSEVFATAEINCHAKLRSLQFETDANRFETSLKEAQFPTFKTNPEQCDVQIEYSSSNDEIATVDNNGKITFKKEGLVTITVTAKDFKQNVVTASKDFVSTNGYFVDPLFPQKSITYQTLLDQEYFPADFFTPAPNGANRLIQQIECSLDTPSNFDENLSDLIVYDSAAKTFKINKEFPAFNQYIFVKVHATVYDTTQNVLNASYEDYFYITKQEVPANTKVHLEDRELSADSENLIEFQNIGDKIMLSIDNPDNLIVQIDGNNYASVLVEDNVVTLTSKTVCDESENIVLRLSIGTKTYILKLKVNAKAESLSVGCQNSPISDDETYQTLLDSLTFDVTKSRLDNQKVTSQVQYQLNNAGPWQNAENDKVTVDTNTTTNVTIKCDDVEVSFNLTKASLSDFGFDASYTINGKTATKSVDSVSEQSQVVIVLPSKAQNTVTFKLKLNVEEYLGGIGTKEDFEKLFKVDLKDESDWKIEHTLSAQQIVVTITESDFTGKEFSKTIGLISGDLEASIQIVKSNLQEIAFVNDSESFDMQKTNDVHKGYQQVRVFAKHSFYDIAGEGKVVDYFKIPLKAISNIIDNTKASLNTISWELTRYDDKNHTTTVLTTQLGDTVTIGEKTYKIVQDGEEYVLKDANNLEGDAVSGKDGLNTDGYIWIDVFSDADEGYARVYFGDFGGLSESDVYNDYFGNFDEKQDWQATPEATDTKKVDGVGGVIVAPSENAYAFLQIQAGDGAVEGENCYFNFNVLQDEELVNVFNADGYYANSKVVLHTNLYGEGEVEQNDTNSNLFLTQTTGKGENDVNVLGKNTIYGNGYSINCQAKNEQFSGENKDKYVQINRMYNVTVKGCNPNETVQVTNQKVTFHFEFAYYCDLQSYSLARVIDADHPAYIKNTVMQYVSHEAFQLYSTKSTNDADAASYIGEKAYIENCAIVDSMLGLSEEIKGGSVPRMHFYMKGQNDFLTYSDGVGLLTKLGQGDKVSLVNLVVMFIGQYFEWFGSNPERSNPDTQRFVNMTTYIGMKYDDDDRMYYWDDSTNSYSKAVDDKSDTELVQADLSLIKSFIPELAVLVCNGFNADGMGQYGNGTRKPNMLYTTDRYTRLLCQYTSCDSSGTVRNDDHILWHKQNVYRDKSLIDREPDHIQHLKSTLMNKGITWPDNTHPEDDWTETKTEGAALVVFPPERRKFGLKVN